jgi:hypothetical protein
MDKENIRNIVQPPQKELNSIIHRNIGGAGEYYIKGSKYYRKTSTIYSHLYTEAKKLILKK